MAYSAAVVSCLVYVSYHWIYASPSQVRLRIEDWLRTGVSKDGRGAALVTPEIVVSASEHRVGDATYIDSISLSAEGPYGPTRVELEDVRLAEDENGGRLATLVPRSPGWGSSGTRSGTDAPRGAEASSIDVGPPGCSVEVRRAVFRVPGVGEGWGGATFLRPLFFRQLCDRWGEDGVDLVLREASIRIDEAPLGEESMAFSDVRVFHRLSALLLSTDLRPCRYWTDGSVEIRTREGAGLWADLRFDDFRLPSWATRWMPAPLAKRWGELSPEGNYNARCVIDSPASSEDIAWEVQLEHFDSGLSLPIAGIDLEHVRGTTWLRDDSVAWGTDAGVQPARVRLGGLDSGLSGVLDDRGAKLDWTIDSTHFDHASIEGAPEWVRSIVRRLRLRGEVEGSVTLTSAFGDTGWRTSLRGRALNADVEPPLHCDAIEVDTTSRSGDGKGELKLSGLALGPLPGSLRGALEISWKSDGAVRVTAADLTWRPDSVRSDSSDPSNPSSPSPAQLRAHAEVHPGRGITDLEVSWTETEGDFGFLSSQRFAGTLRLVRGSAVAATGPEEFTGVFGRCDLGDVKLAEAASPDPTELRFERGRAAIRVESWGVSVLACSLFAPAGEREVARAVRAYGRVSFDGSIDLACLLIEGDFAASVQRWDLLTAVDDYEDLGGQQHRLWRIRGTLDEPTTTRMELSDFVYRYPFGVDLRRMR